MLQFDEATHIYRYEGRAIPSVTQILVAEGFIDTSWFTEEGRMRGKYVHQAIDLYDRDTLDEDNLDTAIVPYLDAWKRFLSESCLTVTDSEKQIYNPTYQYAGTLDKIAIRENTKAILDLKTGDIYPWVGLQLAAYALTTGNTLKRYAIQLNNNGTYRLHEFTDRLDKNIFLSAVSTFHWKRAHTKGGC